MELERRVNKLKELYSKSGTSAQREITKIITGAIRPERVILNRFKSDSRRTK